MNSPVGPVTDGSRHPQDHTCRRTVGADQSQRKADQLVPTRTHGSQVHTFE
jgi:hypothetical protein